MASIVKRGKSYRITVSNGRDSLGKQILETTTFTPDEKMTEKQKKKALEKFTFEFEQKVKSGKLLSGDKMTLSEFAARWLKEYGKNNLTPTTYKNYADFLNLLILPAIGHIKLSGVGPLHLQSFYNSLLEDGVRLDKRPGGYSAATIKKISAILSSLFETAVQWQIVESNPCNRVSTPKVKKTSENIKFFTLEQAQAFLSALDSPIVTSYKAHSRIDDTGKKYYVNEYQESRKIELKYKTFFYIAMFGGLRRGEIIALTWDDINFDDSSITINKSTSYVDKSTITKGPKTETSNRTIKLPSFVMDLIKSLKQEQNIYRLSIGSKWIGENHLFTQWNGKQMNPSTPYHKFKDIINYYNDNVENEEDRLPVIPLHGLRHTAATLLIAENVDVRTVSSRLGHAQTSTTMNIYAHALKKMDEKASDALENAFTKNTAKLPSRNG